MERTAETGCGKTTILFSNLSRRHVVFCIDDRKDGEQSSLRYFEENPLTRREVIDCVLGPTQLTLPTYRHEGLYDCVLLDGPHAYPFPDLEYYFFYPHLRQGGFLLVDDVHIPTVGRMADVLQEDEMFELVEVVETTAVFRRTQAEAFCPTGDSWWAQRFNQRRVSPGFEFRLDDGGFLQPFQARYRQPSWASPPTAGQPPAAAPPVASPRTLAREVEARLRRAAKALLFGR
jgi:hypothetical protein